MPVLVNAFQLDILKKFLRATNPSWDANTNLYISLHTGSPGATGDQTTSEATYTSYARVTVSRDSSGWAISGQNVQNNAAITFPACTGGSNTITYVGIGTASSGTGTLLWYIPLSASLAVSNGITPSFAAGALVLSVS